jgi:hypothetical protein
MLKVKSYNGKKVVGIARDQSKKRVDQPLMHLCKNVETCTICDSKYPVMHI